MITKEELQLLRKGLRKRKLPKISAEMKGAIPFIGSFEVDQESTGHFISWETYDLNNKSNERKRFNFHELCDSEELEIHRFEVGTLISKIIETTGIQVRASIPGPNEAMMMSNPYFVQADNWEHWAKMKPGQYLN